MIATVAENRPGREPRATLAKTDVRGGKARLSTSTRRGLRVTAPVVDTRESRVTVTFPWDGSGIAGKAPLGFASASTGISPQATSATDAQMVTAKLQDIPSS
jgi:hypothetical protein